MSRPVRTYLKREIRKVLPVLILGILYAVFTFGKVFLQLRDTYMDSILSFAYTDWFSIREVGDLFISELSNTMKEFSLIFVVLFSAILVCRVFYLENRAEISDFLRILPVREWQKLWMKVAVGETTILITCAIFGVAGTITNAVLAPGLQKAAEFLPGNYVPADSYQILWQIVLLMFMGMSAIFLVLFAAQSCIHNMGAAFAAGAGILVAPAYFAVIYESVVDLVDGSVIAHEIPLSLFIHYPEDMYNGMIDVDLSYIGGEYVSTNIVQAQWRWFPEKLIFLLAVMLIALAVITAVSVFRWNIRESSNSIINSKAVTEFIFTGISIAVATFVVFASGYDGETEFQFWLTSGIIAVMLLAIANMVLYVMQKRRRGA